MNDIIKVENGEMTAETLNYIKDIETRMKIIKAEYDEYRTALFNAMKENNLIRVENDDLRINFIDKVKKEKFDTKAFKKELPVLYEAYTKLSEISEHITVSIKGDKQ